MYEIGITIIVISNWKRLLAATETYLEMKDSSEAVLKGRGNVPQETKTIATRFISNIFVNCYLIKAGDGFILIDTGLPSKRRSIEKELESGGCRLGNLKLIVLTHGDKDHCGNAAYLRRKFGARIAMHRNDSGMVEHGDMFWNRKPPNPLIRVFKPFFGLSKSDRFEPDLYVEDGYDFSQYGFDTKAIHIPGHSKGSIGILTKSGDLFCGDLLANTNKPDLWSLIDDTATAIASVSKLRGLEIITVYPGHGKPFPMETFINNHR
jgi:glyoxylase-like metal-dependent hydrolase (beta-lactamase superfamily II)